MKNLKKDLNDYAKGLKNSEMIDESHFYDFRQNIFGNYMSEEFQKMFLEGDGNELASKACAVHSSSMLGYNFFHYVSRKPLTIDFGDNQKISYTKVRFEVKMRVFKGRSRPANMDIVLFNDKGDILFIESKFLEYLSTGDFSISDTYKKPETYYCMGEKWASFISSLKTDIKGQYWGGIKQEISHMIGLTNWAYGYTKIDKLPSYNADKDIRFINLVFKPSKEYTVEYEAYLNYKNRYDELHKGLLDNGLIPDGIKMCFKNYSEFWPSFEKCVSLELRDYLFKHYMQYAELQ